MQVSVHINRCQSSWYNANGKSGKQQIMDAKNSVWNVERTSSKLVHFVSIVLIRDSEKIQIDNQVTPTFHDIKSKWYCRRRFRIIEIPVDLLSWSMYINCFLSDLKALHIMIVNSIYSLNLFKHVTFRWHFLQPFQCFRDFKLIISLLPCGFLRHDQIS